MDPSGWIDLLVGRASDLRKAGILSIGVDGCSATISATLIDEVTDHRGSPEPDYAGDPLNDPASYPGGLVPGFEITTFPREEE